MAIETQKGSKKRMSKDLLISDVCYNGKLKRDAFLHHVHGIGARENLYQILTF